MARHNYLSKRPHRTVSSHPMRPSPAGRSPGGRGSHVLAVSRGPGKETRRDLLGTSTVEVKLSAAVSAPPDNSALWGPLAIVREVSCLENPPVQMTPSPGNATRNPR